MPSDDRIRPAAAPRRAQHRRPNDCQSSAGTGTRTRMGLPPQDFKSRASTDFATPALDASLHSTATPSYSLRSTADKRNGSGDAAPVFMSSSHCQSIALRSRAGNGTRTRDPNLGKVVLYQLSYSRVPTSITESPTTTRQAMRATRHGVTPSACTAYQSVCASSPASDASPPFAFARPDSSTCSAANPSSSGARRSHCITSAASGPEQPRALLHEKPTVVEADRAARFADTSSRCDRLPRTRAASTPTRADRRRATALPFRSIADA